MTPYEYRRRITGDAWLPCDQAKAAEILTDGFDELSWELLDEGVTLTTPTHEVRRRTTKQETK